ncbi:MAG: hypothetical protein B6I22_13065 [Desulfobacteraceae bacterium 4572_123]|nr:MAG: hypothetical protein B6I22_13065 [Desulfobacteraceae bacterium 4572_123]
MVLDFFRCHGRNGFDLKAGITIQYINGQQFVYVRHHHPYRGGCRRLRRKFAAWTDIFIHEFQGSGLKILTDNGNRVPLPAPSPGNIGGIDVRAGSLQQITVQQY